MKKKTTKRIKEIMPTAIEKIIRTQNADSNAYMTIQQKRLKELRMIALRKQRGESVQTKEIIENLQSSKILDENGNLSKYYYD